MSSLERDIQNLKRRAKYFNSKNGGHFDLSKLDSIRNRGDYSRLNNSLKRARNEKSIAISRERAIREAEAVGLKPKSKLLTNRSIATLNKEIRKRQKKSGIKNKIDLSTQIDKFMEDVRKYNQNLTRKENSQRLNLKPRTVDELIKYKKVLELASKNKISAAKKILKIKDNKSLYEETVKKDVKQAKKNNDYTYRDRLFLQTSIREANNSALPELGQLFKLGGEGFVKELSKNQFTLFEYAESLSDSDVDNPEEIILSKLEAISRRMSKKNRLLISKFIKMVRA